MRKIEYKIFEDIPGGHSFDRMDTEIAKETRVSVYKHMNAHLKPENPIQTMKDLHQAGYVFWE